VITGMISLFLTTKVHGSELYQIIDISKASSDKAIAV